MELRYSFAGVPSVCRCVTMFTDGSHSKGNSFDPACAARVSAATYDCTAAAAGKSGFSASPADAADSE